MPVLPLIEIAPHLATRGALIGLDLGTKTIGVASSDPDRRLAAGVTTIQRKAFTADASALLALAAERAAVGIVLGLPINMDGTEGPRAQSTRAFARNLSKLTALPIVAVGGTLFASVLLMAGLCFLLRPLLARHLGVDGPAFTSLFQGATRWQTFVVLAVVGNLFGDLGLALASVAMVAMIPLLTVLCVWVLVHYASPSTPHWRDALLAIVQNPFIWACVIGLALNPVASAIPRPVDVFIDALGRSSRALGLLIVGAGLPPRELVHLRAATLVACALKLIVMPAIAIALALAAGLSRTTLTVVVCCAPVPAASHASILP